MKRASGAITIRPAVEFGSLARLARLAPNAAIVDTFGERKGRQHHHACKSKKGGPFEPPFTNELIWLDCPTN